MALVGYPGRPPLIRELPVDDQTLRQMLETGRDLWVCMLLQAKREVVVWHRRRLGVKPFPVGGAWQHRGPERDAWLREWSARLAAKGVKVAV